MADAAPEAQKPKLPIGKILMIVGAVVNLSVLGGGAFMVYQATLGFHPPVTHEVEAMEEFVQEQKKDGDYPVFFHMEPFTANLYGSPQRMIRVEMSIEMLDERGFEEIVDLGAGARDAIVRILNSKELAELETIQGKLFLKDQITITLNNHLKEGVVKEVYFNDFVVQ